MAENFPAMLQNFKSIFKNPFLAKILETVVTRYVDHIIVVVEESKDRIMKKGINGNKITIVSNTPELDLFNKNIVKYRKSIFEQNCLNLLYVGYITPLRGLDIVIRALPDIVNKISGARLTIIGDGIEIANLKKMALQVGVYDHVDFIGWIDFTYIPYIISKCDVGVIPHHSNDHTNSTIPNKIFDFMACGKPIIVSDAKPLKRIVESTGCGVVFKSYCSQDFTNQLLVLEEETYRIQLGAEGEKAVRKLYNWNMDSKRLCHIFNNLF
jgi:glycosyltransferase involved in cell wall biosynthesis